MFMDNKALLDQLMGKDRNKPTYKGIPEQWKQHDMCKPYLLDFCPYELFSNTKMYLGNCRGIHSDVVKQQFESTKDSDKPALIRKYELDFLTQLERILDNIEVRYRKAKERIGHQKVNLQLPSDKQAELDEMNEDISIAMKQVERYAEQGQLDESSLLMSKVEELTNRANERKKELESRYFISEKVCEVCSALSTFSVTADGWIDDHMRGRQHTGSERVRMKVIEIKNRYRLPLARRDRDFTPSESLKHELKQEGREVVTADLENGELDLERITPPRRSRSRSNRGRRRPRERARRSATPDDRRPRRSRSVSSSRSMVSVTFD
jgi:hypothetical protein